MISQGFKVRTTGSGSSRRFLSHKANLDMLAINPDNTGSQVTDELYSVDTSVIDSEFQWQEVVVCSVDRRGKLKAINCASLQLFGLESTQLLGYEFLKLICPDDMRSTQQALAAVIKEKTAILFDNRVIDNTGKLTKVGWSAHWSETENCIICVGHSINQTSELDQFRQDIVDMVVHDLRSPLTSMQLSLTLLACGSTGDLPQDAMAEIAIAQRNADRLINLINDFLDFRKLQVGELAIDLEDTHLDSILLNAVRSVQALAKVKGIRLEVKQTDALVMADNDRLTQVFENLLSNAIKFSPERGTVRVLAEQIGEYMEVKVKDNGPGILQEYKDLIFQRYKQAPNQAQEKRKSTGLGLFICKAIIERHGGTIGVESNSRETTFWFRLPLKGQSMSNQLQLGQEQSFRNINRGVPFQT